MRGKVFGFEDEIVSSRITPAYAGKRVTVASLCISLRGSPPPMRGKVCGRLAAAAVFGITPAYAGKS